MKNYIVVYKDNNYKSNAHVKGEMIDIREGQLTITTGEHGTVFMTPLDLIHHVMIDDEEVAIFKNYGS